MPPAVQFRDAVSLSGGFPLLAGITLEVAEGESVHLRGPNGAGKTSLLRACAGLVAINAGEAEVLGHDLRSDRESLRREVGLMGHGGALYDDLTVEENVRFAVRAARGDTAAVAPALERLGLSGRLGRTLVGKLSAGQRRRAALASLVARRPRLWLLDEPHAGLDEIGRAILDELVAEWQLDGATILLASHELERAAGLVDRVVSLAGGHVVSEQPGTRGGPPMTSLPEVEGQAGARSRGRADGEAAAQSAGQVRTQPGELAEAGATGRSEVVADVA
ncbi:MAG TPA: heme ABC exporter ATP-binding protein CcmA [Acidimicrobiales bacterium]|nr:heme ABC exporter ATP-binding protein CcmA [Acidimicrobiales bacterium]